MLIRSLIFCVYCGTTLLIGTTGIYLLWPFPVTARLWVAHIWCRGMLWFGGLVCGLQYVVEGSENVPDEPCVIMIKHSSLFEAYAQAGIFPRTTWVVKKELLWAPVFGWGVAMLKPIAIDRSSGSTAVKQVIAQGQERLADGISLTVFPEGTRMAPGATRRYGISGAALAEAAGCQILPVAHNAADLWSRSGFPQRPGLIRICIGPPIDPAGRPPKETNLMVQDWIENKMAEISEGYRDKTGAEAGAPKTGVTN